MRAADVMTANVIAVQPDTGNQEIAGLLLKHRISAVLVIDAKRTQVLVQYSIAAGGKHEA